MWWMCTSSSDRAGRRSVGYLPENLRVPRHHTGHSALAYFGGLSGLSPRDVRNRRGQILALVGLTGWGDVSVRKYSKGMQQRLGLAQALLHDPEMLILDEPTDGVDPVGAGQHVADEPLVARDVDERHHPVRADVHVGEAEVDGDPALLLLLEAVGIRSGERAHQGALAVVDVAGGADDQGAHGQG